MAAKLPFWLGILLCACMLAPSAFAATDLSNASYLVVLKQGAPQSDVTNTISFTYTTQAATGVKYTGTTDTLLYRTLAPEDAEKKLLVFLDGNDVKIYVGTKAEYRATDLARRAELYFKEIKFTVWKGTSDDLDRARFESEHARAARFDEAWLANNATENATGNQTGNGTASRTANQAGSATNASNTTVVLPTDLRNRAVAPTNASPCAGALTVQCDGVCVNLANDDENCGACGIACPDGRECAKGACVLASCDVACTRDKGCEEGFFCARPGLCDSACVAKRPGFFSRTWSWFRGLFGSAAEVVE